MDKNEILMKNYAGELGTFIGELHEKNRIDKKLFSEYVNSIKIIAKEHCNRKQLDRKLTYIIFFTYSYFLKRAFWNASDSDLSKIIGVTDVEINDYIEEISSVVESYIICE